MLLVLPISPAFGVLPETDFVDIVRGAVVEGRLTEEEALVQVFRYAFAPAAVRADLLPAEPKPLKCLTPYVLDFERMRETMDGTAASEIAGYLRGETIGKTTSMTYNSPDGLFRLTYETSGPNAPPQDDVNPANGVPDYVEWVASYCDSSWHREIDQLGFNAPALSPGDLYPISFENMGAYGYTVQLSGGRSRIVLENDFFGFPANQDPDGRQKGAAKVTCAHEFKHASQMNTTGAMSMGGWVELDATWMEDVVYDLTNDYYNYLGSGSGISNPELSLDDGGSGSYEDCIWQHHLCETYGLGMGLDLMHRREAYPGEAALLSWAATIEAQGSDLQTAITNFATWNYRCGILADTSAASLVGYEEAMGYPTSMAWSVEEVYPDTNTGAVARMAAHIYQCKGMATIDRLRIRFTGTVGTEQRVVALLRLKGTLGGGWVREDVPLDAESAGDYTVSMPGSDLKQIAVLIVNPKRTGGTAAYTVVFESSSVSTPVAGAAPAASFELRANLPNPFNPQTTVAFSVHRDAAASLVVYNPAGRVIRTLLSGEKIAAGPHSVVWDGRDDRGAQAASGVYFYRLVAEDRSETRKMLLLR
jgi:hypothetical protein